MENEDLNQRNAQHFDIVGKEFASFIEEKCSDLKCSACGSANEPVLHADSADGPVHLSASPILKPQGYGNKGHCTLHCQNCGFMWFFDASVVSDWVIEQRKEARCDEPQ